jgi:hypothetical protein
MNSKYQTPLTYSAVKSQYGTRRNMFEPIEIGMYKLYFQTQIIYNCKKKFYPHACN